MTGAFFLESTLAVCFQKRATNFACVFDLQRIKIHIKNIWTEIFTKA